MKQIFNNDFISENNARIMSSFSFQPRLVYEKRQEEKQEDYKEMRLIKDMLADIYNRPFVSSTDRAIDLHLSNEKAKRVYRHIESKQLVDIIFFNLTGRGGQSKFYSLTESGCYFIEKQLRLCPGKNGKEHAFLQEFLSDFLRKQGYSGIETEKVIDDRRYDLFCLDKNRKRLMVEICLTTFKTEYQKCIDANAEDRNVIVCTDNNAKKKVVEELKGFRESVEVYALHEFLKVFKG